MNYYDHDTRVKIIDGILAHEQTWDWFIEHTEANFEVELNGTSFKKAQHSFQEIRDVFYFLSRIHDISNQQLPITKNWLKEIDLLAQFYIGTQSVQIDGQLSNFYKIMQLLIYSGKIWGQIKDQRYYYDSNIFTLRNLFLLDDLSMFVDEENTILQLLDQLEIDCNEERQIFLANINQQLSPANQAFLERHNNALLNANCFSFTMPQDDHTTVWEEVELLRMLAVSVQDGKLVPHHSSGDTSFPDFSIWTSDRLADIRSYFNSESATFIVESIDYILNGVTPSEYTVNQHFNLLYQLIESTDENLSYHLDCSSLEFIMLFFSDDSKRLIHAESHIKFGKVLNKLFDNNCFDLLYRIKARKALCNKDISKKLSEYTKQRRDSIENISDLHSFLDYIKDESIRSAIDKSHFVSLTNKFDTIITSSQGILVANAFLEYFLFLLRIKNNKDIVASQVSAEIIRIRAMWQNTYYPLCTASMQTIASEPITIPATYSDQVIQLILALPPRYAISMMKLQQTNMIAQMQQISSHPLILLVSNILIDEDFPAYPLLKLDAKHPIDLMYSAKVKQIIENYGYKFLNSFSVHQYTQELFKRLKQEMQISAALLNDLSPLYTAVVLQNPEYVFLEYPTNMTLGHLTQFFPILENKIRDFGEMCGIVPVCEDPDLCHRLKEPDVILNMVLKQIQEMGGSFADAPDLFFIHFCMFGENGLNIRNACIHGNDYLSNERMQFAFKVTLISLYMIGWRIDMILRNTQPDTVEAEADDSSKKEDNPEQP